MNCQAAKPLIEIYADGELDAARILELEKHIHECPACAFVWRNAMVLKKSIKQHALALTAPIDLRRDIMAELRSQVKRWSFWNWNRATAISSTAVACFAVLLVITLIHPSAQQQLTQEIVSSHVRSLMANHMLDVVSTDQHTVKPWFNGKLDFSPPVKDLAVQEFPLIGGRLDYIGDRSVAALVFQRHKHIINLFIWPANEHGAKPAVLPPIQGYNVIHWSETGMTFWTVSDLNESELMEFVQDFSVSETLNP